MKTCQVTGKHIVTGNNVSHANNKTKRRFRPNIHEHRFWSETEQRFLKLKVSAKGIRIIDKIGLDAALEKIRCRKQTSKKN
jgi:large subunit ribosomal protein L28